MKLNAPLSLALAPSDGAREKNSLCERIHQISIPSLHRMGRDFSETQFRALRRMNVAGQGVPPVLLWVYADPGQAGRPVLPGGSWGGLGRGALLPGSLSVGSAFEISGTLGSAERSAESNSAMRQSETLRCVEGVAA